MKDRGVLKYKGGGGGGGGRALIYTRTKLCKVVTKEPIRVVLNSYRKIQTYYFSFYTLLKVWVATTS